MKVSPLAQKKALWLLSIILFVTIVDRLTKYWAIAELKGQSAFEYMMGFLVIVYAENKGAFLSFGSGFSEGTRFWLLSIGSLLLVLYAIYYIFKSQTTLLAAVGLSCIVSGGFGNLIDRFLDGYVVDFAVLVLGPLKTGVFNVADMAIVAGVILLVFEPRLTRSKKPNEESKS